MNKVVCDICGTTYPENAAQCPICGFARSADNSTDGTQESSYTYVKGGRFSKANVRKRNVASQKAAESHEDAPVATQHKKSNVGLTVVVIVLLLAIIAVVGYIALRFFVPNNLIFEGLENFTTPTYIEEAPSTVAPTVTEPQDTEAVEESVEVSITLSEEAIQLTGVGETFQLFVTVDPAENAGALFFSSTNGEVATVDSDGIVTANGEGSAVISVSCGNAIAECEVTCSFTPVEDIPQTPEETEPAITIKLNRKEITFNTEGQSWVIYDGEIPATSIVWSSDDNSVAMITDGKVVAMGNGDTVVYAMYEGQTVSCKIHCAFEDEPTSGQTGGITEAAGTVKRTYKLYNPYGNADDATIRVGEEFTLKLVDEEKNDVPDVTWTIEDDSICSYSNNIVKGLKAGTSEISATVDGNTYTCIVRVKE